MTIKSVVALVLALIVSRASAGTEMEEQFQHPPDSARPRTWWHWVSGNVSAEGITADLDAMKTIGLGGLQLFTVDQSNVKGPVKFMSPEWRQFVHQALTEADKLGLEVSIEGCDGWSESGGPWITPAQGMQKIVWTEVNVKGGAKVPLNLPQPQTNLNYYQDVALLAFPTLRSDDLPAQTSVKCNDPDVDASALSKGAIVIKPKQRSTPLTFDVSLPAMTRCRSIAIDCDGHAAREEGILEVSGDGQTYTKVGTIALKGQSIFAPAVGTHFRITFSPKASDTDGQIRRIQLSGARIDRFADLVGMRPKLDIPFTDAMLSPEDVIDPAKVVDLTGKSDWDAPAGDWTIVRMGHTAIGTTTHPSTHPGLECDKMSRDAVRFHLEQMYGPILSDSPDVVGKSLRYILLDSWEAGCADWTPLMAKEFTFRRGYDLKAWLPVFTGRFVKDGESTQRFLWDLRRTIADLVTENHYGTVQQFAHEHHLGVYAEAPGVSLPTVADNLACKGRTDIPMGEFWVNKSNDQNIDDPKEAASAGHIYGKNIIATESFTSTPNTAAWKNDPYSLKQLGDMEFCLGVNRFVFHRYAHQPWMDRQPGMSMGPWGINFERTNTWWKPGTAWISYLSRCESMLQRGQFVADLLYFYGEGATAGVSHNTLSPAPPAGFDYDVCNAEILLEQTSVDDQGDLVLKSGTRYRVLVLPNTDRMTLPMLEKIRDLVKSGVTVYGPRPVKSPSLANADYVDHSIQQIAAVVWGDCDGNKVTSHTYGKGKIRCGGSIETALPKPDFTASAPDTMFIHRRDGDAELYFVSNQQHVARTINCTFRVNGKVPEIWHPDSGQIETAAMYQSNDTLTTVPIHFDPVGSVFVVFRKSDQGTDPVASVKLDSEPTTASDDSKPAINLQTTNDGQLNLTVWQGGAYTLSTRSGKAVNTKVDKLPAAVTVEGPWKITFPPKLGAPETATFDRLMSWSESTDNGVKFFSGTAEYHKTVTLPALARGQRAYLDLGDVKNLAEVEINGKSLGVLWKEPFMADITDAAKAGENQATIRVTNLWPNRIIGDQSLPENQRITWASVSLYKAVDKLLPSGLLGPVHIVLSQTVSLKSP